MIESGSCAGAALISTKSECEAAATALGLSDRTAYDSTSTTSSYWPPGCVYARFPFIRGDLIQDGIFFPPFGYRSFSLYVYGGGNFGSCSSSNKCICKG